MDPHKNEGVALTPQMRKSEGPWAPFEDEVLRMAIRQTHGPQALERSPNYTSPNNEGPTSLKWSDISELCIFHGCRRVAKQCRERFVNHLDPELDPGPLNEAQVQFVIRWVKKNGKKWAPLGRIMRKAENAVKNQWYQHKKKNRGTGRSTSTTSQAQAYPHNNRPSQTRSHPDPTHASAFDNHHSRRASNASSFSTPGLCSDAGSPADSFPPSPYGDSYAAVFADQLALPRLAGSKNASPRLSLASSSTLERARSASSVYASPYDHESPYGGGGNSHPMRPYYSEGANNNSRVNAPQAWLDMDSNMHRREPAFDYQSGRPAPLDAPIAADRPRHDSTHDPTVSQLERMNQHHNRDPFLHQQTTRNDSSHSQSSSGIPRAYSRTSSYSQSYYSRNNSCGQSSYGQGSSYSQRSSYSQEAYYSRNNSCSQTSMPPAQTTTLPYHPPQRRLDNHSFNSSPEVDRAPPSRARDNRMSVFSMLN